MEAQNAVEMPKYRSHKTVHALKIQRVSYCEDGSAVMFPRDLNVYAPIEVGVDFTSRHLKGNNGVGDNFENGYYVVYSDGYASFSPTEAFEDGYSKVVE